MRRIRKLARLLYDKLKSQPWRTIETAGYGTKGKIDSPEVWVNGREYDLQMRHDGLFLAVTVRVGGMVIYPGGKYHMTWPWCWEKKVFRRVIMDYNNRSTTVIPDDDVLDADIAALSPPKAGPDGGRLSLEKKNP